MLGILKPEIARSVCRTIILVGLLSVALSNAATAAQPFAIVAGEAEAPSWYRGNTHTHTLNSNDVITDTLPIDVAHWYRDHGYQFLVITDHDYVTDVAPVNASVGAPGEFLVIGGEEITQTSLDPTKEKSFTGSKIGAPLHVNSLFLSDLILPVGQRLCEGPRRCAFNAQADMPARELFKRNLETIQARGGIAQINHPTYMWATTPEDLALAPDSCLLEIGGGGGDDGGGHVSPSGEGFWDWMLSRGKIVWGEVSDDSHIFNRETVYKLNVRPAGNGWIMVRADKLTADNLKAAILSGNFYASTGVELSSIRRDARSLKISIKTRAPAAPGRFTATRYSTKFIGQNGEVLATVAGLTPSYQFTGRESYVRAVVTDGGSRAWTQPVFFDHRKDRSPYAP